MKGSYFEAQGHEIEHAKTNEFVYFTKELAKLDSNKIEMHYLECFAMHKIIEAPFTCLQVQYIRAS